MTDIDIAQKYVNKCQNAKQKGHEFDLSFVEFKRLMTRKYCSYSGIELTEDKEKFSSRTIDRTDNSLGYIKGNVKTIAYGVNMLKAQTENPDNPLTADMLYRTAKEIKKDMRCLN